MVTAVLLLLFVLSVTCHRPCADIARASFFSFSLLLRFFILFNLIYGNFNIFAFSKAVVIHLAQHYCGVNRSFTIALKFPRGFFMRRKYQNNARSL